MADHVLVIQDAAHAHQAENVDLTQAHALAIDDAAHAHAAENVDLAQTHILTIQDAAHAHTATEIDLSTPGVIRAVTWTPSDSAIDIDQGRTVRVDFEADDSNELESLFETGSDFENGGTLNDLAVSGDQLQLATVIQAEDFESPRHSADDKIDLSNHWTFVSSNENIWIRDDIGGETNQYAHGQMYNSSSLATFDDFGVASDVDVRSRIRFGATRGSAGIIARVTGSGSSTRGYIAEVGRESGNIFLRRITGDNGAAFGIWSIGATFDDQDTWIRIRYQITGTTHRIKVWYDGETEPGSWQLTRTDGTHAGPGAVGIRSVSDSFSSDQQFDDFSATAIPPTYETTGDWITDPLDLAPVDRYSSSRISWEETLPANTTIDVETRIDGGGWSTPTNGAEIPGFTYDDFLAGKILETRVTLSTTDDSVTPAVENLRIFFDPLEFEDLEILVDSLSATVANGLLLAYGKDTPTGNDYSGLIAEAALLGWYRTPARGTVSAELKYNGVSIASISFSGDTIPIAESVGPWNYYSFPALPLESSPTDNVHQWTAGDHDIITSQIYEWVLIDKGIAIRADAFYYVGHPTIFDIPSSILAALVALDDHPGSILAEGYNLDDFASSCLAQAHQRDDFPASILPAVRAIDDFLGSTVIAIQEIHDEPASLLVFAVNRENVIELHVISESTFAALGGEGITWN